MNIKLAIHTPEKHQFDHVCEILESMSFVGFSNNDIIYKANGHDTCISFKTELSFSHKSYYEKDNYKIVTYEAFCGFFGIGTVKKAKERSAEEILSEIANLISEFPTTVTK